MLMPKRVKYRRVQRGRMKGKATRGNVVTYGEFGLQAQEPCWITSNQIEAARIAMTRYTKRGGQVWIKIFPDKPVTAKPAETRMGSGSQAGQGHVRDRGRLRGDRARGSAPCQPQAALQDEDRQQGGFRDRR